MKSHLNKNHDLINTFLIRFENKHSFNKLKLLTLIFRRMDWTAAENEAVFRDLIEITNKDKRPIAYN